MTVHSRQLPVGDIKALVKALGVQERVLLFCLGSGTDWKEAGVTLETVAGMVGKVFVRPIVTPKILVMTNSGGSPRPDRCRPRRTAGAVAGPMRRQDAGV